jgi:hypothetical protein
MSRTTTLFVTLLLLSGSAVADDAAQADKAEPKAAAKQSESDAAKPSAAKNSTKGSPKTAAVAGQPDAPQGDDASSTGAAPTGDVKMSGMSILGNEEAPKSLVIVPWKSSQLGDMPGVARLLDSATQPVDKEVFMRELAYYEIRSKAQ